MTESEDREASTGGESQPRHPNALIIGAGLGGLACGVELARQGMKVTVLEGASLPGGCLRTFRKQGYHFHISPQYLGALQPGGATRGILHSLGVLAKLQPQRPELFMSAEFPDFTLKLPNDREGMLEVLSERFPREREGLARLFALLREMSGAVVESFLRSRPDDQRWREVLAPWRDRSFAELLSEHVVDPRLRALLGQTWMNLGLPPSLAAAPYNAAVFSGGWLDGIHTVAGGGTALVRALLERLRELGGECLLNKRVERILVHNHRVQGLRLAGGEEIECPLVVAAVDPYQVFFRMMPSDAVSRLFRFRLERMEPSVSMYTLHLGLDCPPSQLDIPRCTSFINTQPDHEEAYRRAVEGELHHSSWRLTSYEGAHDECYPRGGGIVALTEVAATGRWLELDEDAYLHRKSMVYEVLLNKAEERFPGLMDHVIRQDLATPRSLARLFGSHGGAAYGFAPTVGQSGSRRLGVRAPVTGLFLAGAWTGAGGGCESVILGGVQAASAVMAYAERPRRAPAPVLATSPEAPKPVGPPRPRTLNWPDEPPLTSVLYEHRYPVRVYGGDLNSRGHADVEAYLRYLDRARQEAIEAICEAHEVPSWHDSHVVNVYRVQARCATVVGLSRDLEVQTGLRRVSTHRGAFHQRVVDKASGGLLVDGSVEVTFLDFERTMVPLPPEFPHAEGFRPVFSPGQLRSIPFTEREQFPFRTRCRSYFEDTDLQGVTFHVSYLRFAERALFDLVRTVWPGLGTRTWMSRYRVGICGGDLRYLRPTRLGERLEVWTAVLSVHEAEMAFAQRIVLQDSEEVVSDFVTLVEFRDENEQVIPLPRPLVDVAIANLFRKR